jgi:hypothetical protein
VIHQQLLRIGLRGGRRADVECNPERLGYVSIFDRKLPREENLDAILVRCEVCGIESTAAAPNDGMGLASIEDHNRAAA